MPQPIRTLLVTIALLSAPGPFLSAQEPRAEIPLSAGQRTRVTFERWRKPLVGEFVSADSAAVVIRLPEIGRLVTVDWTDISRVDVSVAQRSRLANTGRGMLFGFAAGAAIGGTAVLVSMWSDADERCTDCFITPTAGWAILAILGTAGTTVLGGVIGAVRPLDRWKRIPLEGDPPRLIVRPLPSGGMALGISLGGSLVR